MRVSGVCLVMLMLGATVASAEGVVAERALVDLSAAEALHSVTAGQPDQVTVSRIDGEPGVVVTCRPGANAYPGVVVKPQEPVWDLSAFGHVEARITNRGKAASGVSLRVDNAGDWTTSPWNSETVWLRPGETGTVRVRFGYSWGNPGFALDPSRIPQMLVFVGGTDQEQMFRLEGLVAGGAPGEKPPVNPWDVRTRPEGGVLLGEGTQVVAAGKARAELLDEQGTQALRVTLPAGDGEAAALLKPAVGMWDLRDWLEVSLHARNDGAGPAVVRARLESRGQPGPWVSTDELAPGAEADLVLPSAGGVVELGEPGTATVGGSSVEGDAVSGVALSATGDGERVVVLGTVRATVPPAPELPAWLGSRPPVPGEWQQTLAEEFDGAVLNDAVWSIRHPNYWDKRSHFSQDNVILGDGVLRLRFEKKRGHADDDPAKPETDWATGFITSTTKWRQRYGYFECRIKLPKAPGLWPAFWMMPDRGPDAGPGRESTSNGGMEFDILEYLTRYGPYRYNIACHWDDYGKDHKSTGTDRIYVQPDSEGFITAGLLWGPGQATFYANGQPVCRFDSARVASVPEYILFTAVSGGWGGNELTGEGLPDDLVLDYVRAWQREDWAGDGEPANSE